ncbi:MAG TPA: hypothetical protein VF181_04015 [Balneolaceae bacterium]
MDSLENFECYDHLLYEPFKERGWQAETVSWRNRHVEWNRFDVVIIRSTWDYQQDYKAFIEVLREIEQSSARLVNDLELVEWNIDKTYLRDLEEQGINTVPSLWCKAFKKNELNDFFTQLESNQIVIKPTISAGADNTFWIKQENAENYRDELSDIFKNRPFLVQPFMPNIISEGEFSVFFFGETYSHTILKTPKKNDFRVQEEHGGILRKVEPEEQLLASARKLLQTLTPKPFYTRIDYVRSQNSFSLMELELIEPSLYFNMDDDSPARFAEAFVKWVDKAEVKSEK